MQQRVDAGATVEPFKKRSTLAACWIRLFRRVSHLGCFSGERFLLRNQLAEILIMDLDDAVLDVCLEIIHRTRRRSGNASAVFVEHCGVAWADELLFFFIPRDRTTE